MAKVSNVTLKDIILVEDLDRKRSVVIQKICSNADNGLKIARTPKTSFCPPDMVKFIRQLTLDIKRTKWREELQQHEEYLVWFHKNEPYMNSLEFQGYDRAAQEAKAAIKKLRNQIRYARR